MVRPARRDEARRRNRLVPVLVEGLRVQRTDNARLRFFRTVDGNGVAVDTIFWRWPHWAQAAMPIMVMSGARRLPDLAILLSERGPDLMAQ